MRDAAQPATASTTSVRMVRYAFNVEQSEGGKKVLKQVTVIVPELPRDGREREIRRLRPASSVVFLAPHTRRAPGPAGSSAAPAPPPPRRLSLTTLSNVSLLPPPRPIQPFVSLAGAGAQVEQRRRAGVSLRAADAPLQAWAEAEGMERVSAWARDQRARLVRKRDGEDEDECDATWDAAMDPFSASAGPSSAPSALHAPAQLHSTTVLLSSAVALAHSSLQDHIDDYADAHRWIDSFFDKIDGHRAPASHGAPRPGVFELMKTPGRKRTAGANSTNTHLNPPSAVGTGKDPLATLLFPPAGPSPRSPARGDKENAGSSAPQCATPRTPLSPPGGGAAIQKLSPMRLGSPAPSKQAKQRAPAVPAVASPPAPEPVVKAIDFAPAPPPVDDEAAEIHVHDLSNVMEEEEDEEDVVNEASVADGDEKADLSIIGEEEEDEDNSHVSAVTAPSSQPSLVAPASIIPETQITQTTPPSPVAMVAPTPALPLSPQARIVSGASSVAPEADDTEDISVPLNDAPSALRSAGSDALRSSLSTATVRTPGNASSRFATGSYSAAKGGLGSSPPPTVPSTVGPALPSTRTSTGGSGARQINFVGLSRKKSLGLGLGLGRNWAASMGSSAANDSQGSIPSQAQSTQATTAPSSSHNSLLESVQTGATTATGATKRKSLNGPDLAHKAQKVDAAQSAQEQEAEEARKRREALANRIQSMQARQSNLGGRASNVAGPNAFASSIFGAGKPGASSLFHPASAAQASKPLLPTSTILPTATSSANLATTNAGTDAASAAARRPSVMERVKSFEYSTSGAEHLHPPSPSKIPAAFSGPHSPRATSPPPGAMSPRALRVVSPSAPASPRPLTRSATSGLPLATFGTPKLGAAVTRSPPLATSASASAPLSIASVLSPPTAAARAAAPAQEDRIPVALPKSPARSPVHTVESKPVALTRSTTPMGSPPRPATAASPAPVRLAAPPPAPMAAKRAMEVVVLDDEEDELEDEDDDDDDEEEEVLSIRAINASTPASAIVEAQAAAARAKAAAEQAARDLEEQEAERERVALLQKRLPSLPEVQPAADDDADESADEDDDEMAEVGSIVTTATREDLAVKASPSKIVMPGTFGAALAGKAREASSAEASEAEDDDDEDDDEEDRTTMSVVSSATTATLNLSHQPFKPITKTAQLSKQGSKTSLASSVSSTSAFGLNRSVGASGLKKPADTKVKSIQRAAAAAKKEKEETDRKNAVREQKRTALLQKKQDDERKLKAEGLEKKRKEREENATKAKAGAVRSAKQKPAADDEPAKKRKIEPEPKVRPDLKKAGQPTRPVPTAPASQHTSLATSQSRAGAMGPPALNKSSGPSGTLSKSVGPAAAAFSNPLSKSAGASAMVGQSFMSAKIRLPDSSAQAGPSRPLAPTVPKPFSSAMRPPQAVPAPAPKPAEPQEAYQELPDIDSEYSDSDDEAHERKNAELPRWARSPALAQALYDQQQVNPDEIFGPIPKLAIGEFFRNSHSAARLRARTSSAQWDGTDALTQTDLARYQRAMGYKSSAQTTSSTLVDTPKEQPR
ncbi:hypothetical protein JCM3770_005049 [Rhodotorula araucariae]